MLRLLLLFQLRKAEAIERTSQRDMEEYRQQGDHIKVNNPSSTGIGTGTGTGTIFILASVGLQCNNCLEHI